MNRYSKYLRSGFPFLLLAGCGGGFALRQFSPESAAIVWSGPRGNAQNTGYVAGQISRAPEIVWSRRIGALDITSAAICGKFLFIGTPTKRIVALDAETGDNLGDLWVDVPMMQPPAICDGKLFFMGFGGYNRVGSYNLERNKTLWSRFSGDAETVPLVRDSIAIVATLKGGIYALSANDGEIVRQVRLDDAIHALPAMRNDTIWVAAGKKIYCIGASCEIIWRRKIDHSPGDALTIAENSVLMPTTDGILYALDCATGEERWRYDGKLRGGLPVAVAGENIVFAMPSGTVFCIGAWDGEIRWQREIMSPVAAAPIIVGSAIIICTYAGKVLQLDIRDGSIISETNLGKPIRSSPSSDGEKILISAQNGMVFCLH